MKLYIEDINTPSLEDEDYRYLEMRSEGRKYYNIYRGIKNNKGVWAAVEVDRNTMKEIGEPFEITYDQGRGLEQIDPDNNRLQKMVGKALGLRRESIVESPVATVYTEGLRSKRTKNYIKEAPDSKARYEIAENIASWVFGSPNMNDIDDNLNFLVNRFMKGSTLVDRMYMCDTYEELADVLSNCSLKLLMTIERGLCIDEDSIGYETDYIRKMYGESKKRLREQDVEIEVKHEGILEVPEGKNVDDLPMSHFEKLAKKKGLGKITKALNNLQVWNKNDDPKLSKWAGNMIDKLNKKLKKDESFGRLSEAKPRQTITVDIPKKEYDFHFKGVDQDGWKREVNRVQVIYGHKGQFVELVLIDDNGVRLSSARKKFKVVENDIVLTDYDKNDIVIGKIEKIDTNESFIKKSGVKSYWSYDLMDVDDNKYYDKRSIRRIKLIPCDNPDDCYADFGGTTSWAVCDTDCDNEVFCTKDQAYSYLLDTINRNRYEREHDI